MKTLLTLTAFYYLFVFNSYAQTTSIKATYNLTYKLDSTSNYARHEKFILYIYKNKSLFKSQAQIKADSLTNHYIQTMSKGGGLLEDAFSKIPLAEFTYSIYKNSTTNAVVYTDEIEPGAAYGYQEPNDFITWKIMATTTLINGYSCQKAVTSFRGRQFTAWFTKQIPVAEGPYKFFGLPGLIIKISDSKNYYIFELIGLTQLVLQNLNSLNVPSKSILTTRAKFKRAQSNFDATVIDRASQFGMSFSNPEQAKNNWKENLRSRNNPLEIR